jgi:serine/threonine protein kinase
VAPAKIEPGDILGHTYEIEALLARGGMGEVYRARHIELGSIHAIKVILPDLTSDPRIVAMFKEEAKKLRKVRDDGIVAYEGLFRDEFGRRYLVMEYVDGVPLATLIKQRPLTPDEVRRLRDRCALGLAAAHDKGIYHRDISPDNIILVEGKTEFAKIIDFGIAKSADPGDRTVIGQDFAGKYSYVSPEQLGAYGGQVDGRSDIYSLGLVLVAAAQGRALDMGNSPVSVIEKRQRVPDLSAVPAELRDELAALLQPDPKDRPQSMRDLAMRNVAPRPTVPRDVPVLDLPPKDGRAPVAVIPDDGDIMPPDPAVPSKQAAPAPPPAPPRRSPVMAIAVAVISFLVVVGAGAAYMLLGKSNPSSTVTASAPAEVPIPPPSTPAPAVPPPPAAVATASPPTESAVPPPQVPPPAPVASTSPPPSAVPATASPTPAPPAPAAAAAPTQTAALPIAPKLRDETNASLQHLFAGFQCADLTADVSDDLRVNLAGFVGQQGDLDKLHNELHGMEHVKLGTDTVAVYTFPHCAFVKLLRETASAAPAAAAPRLDFNKPSRVYKNGDKLTVKATEGKQRDGYLYVDYIDNGGTVVHIFPTPLRKNNFVKAGQQVSIGTTDPNAKGDERVYEISEPFGPNLIIAISSPKPLFEAQPDEAEPADQYLRSLQARLTAMAATPAGKEMSSTYSLIDTVP